MSRSNNWTVTIKCLLMSNLDSLGVELGSPSNRELVTSCLSFLTRPISLQIKFYNSRYSLKSEETSDSNSPISRQ